VKLNKKLEPELSYEVTDVTENQEYEFRVSAENAEGQGPPCDAIGPIKAKDAYGECHYIFESKQNGCQSWTPHYKTQ
jgi:hypothetical protein